MKKLSIALLTSSTLLLAGCGTLDALGDASIQKKQLADGTTVSVGTNLVPTANWNCKMVKTSPAFKWSELQKQTSFSITENATTLLTGKAINYANANQLKTNYINLEIPEEKTLATGPLEWNLRRHAQAFATYYQCEKINPEHKIGMQKKTEWGFN